MESYAVVGHNEMSKCALCSSIMSENTNKTSGSVSPDTEPDVYQDIQWFCQKCYRDAAKPLHCSAEVMLVAINEQTG